MTGLPWVWGATAAEACRAYPADEQVPAPALRMTRATTVQAPAALTWRWLCQIAVAPYSYDLIDNLGRRSPRTLTPGADDLVLGQKIGVLFDLVDLDPGHHWTGLISPRSAVMRALVGPVATTYAAERVGETTSRIVCRIAVADGGLPVRTRAAALAWGDLVMIRKQLRTLAGLAATRR